MDDCRAIAADFLTAIPAFYPVIPAFSLVIRRRFLPRHSRESGNPQVRGRRYRCPPSLQHPQASNADAP